MKVVIDCNIFVTAVSANSKYHSILQHLIKGSFSLLISTEVYFEYHEIISIKYRKPTADAFINALENSPFVIAYYPSYRWNLITKDPDDNKYADLYIAGGADYLVTEDSDFKSLKNLRFPQINILSIEEFFQLLKTL
jgi:putative PIN family toxin of toxin-antitoxin system